MTVLTTTRPVARTTRGARRPLVPGAQPVVARTRAELAAALSELTGPRHFVPTMGALHAGHAALLSAAGPGSVLSIFVNPLQFGAGEDLDRYPRSFEADVALAAAHDVAVVFAPSASEMYPIGPPAVTVSAGPIGSILEGAARPGHFDGMLTVVAKLFGLVRPDVAYFGAKDAQQLALVRTMVTDLELGVTLAEVSTVREIDGLALSSRNAYLSPDERAAAAAIPRAIATGTLAAARAVLAAEPRLEVDYCVLADPTTLTDTDGPSGRLLIAVKAGRTRLIDNHLVGPDVAVLEIPPPDLVPLLESHELGA